MKKPTALRVLKITAFALLDIVLGVYFMVQQQRAVPAPLQQVASLLNLQLPDVSERAVLYQELHAPDITPETLFAAANSFRTSQEVTELVYSDKLASIAAQLLSEYQVENFTAAEAISDKQLTAIAKKAGYSYNFLSHQILIGPVTTAGITELWYTNTDQKDELLSTRNTQVGYATFVADQSQPFGVVVQVLAQPSKNVQAVATGSGGATSAQSVRTPAAILKAPDISDDEVVAALNSYRATHNLYPLQVNENLCEYAQKRVGDLIAFGGLDGHAGFTADFATRDSLPVGIRDYPGGGIGENLAHQYCKNMTTGDSFIAQTGTAIIEWCFDSSTKGHREAQLSTTFHNVCVRHGDNMYVVIFGE